MNKEKINLVVDFDSTLGDSMSIAIQLFAEETGRYIPKVDLKTIQWNFGNIPNVFPEDAPQIIKQFENPKMYKLLKPFDNCIEVLTYLSNNGFNIIFCTKGSIKQFELKSKWLSETIQDKFSYTTLFMQSNSFNKSFIGGTNSIIIDDNLDCILNGYENRLCSIVFGNYGYNDISNLKLDKVGKLTSWEAIKNFIVFHFGCYIDWINEVD